MATVMGGGTNYQDDRESLARFLLDTQKVLLVFFEFREQLLPDYMRKPFALAWMDVDMAIWDSVSMLRGIDTIKARRPIPPSLILEGYEIDERLEFFGLTGAQLSLKLSSFYSTYRQVMEGPPIAEMMATPATTNAQRKMKKKKFGLMGWLLEKINSILGSLARVIPSVDIIKEFKEMAEFGYKESQRDVVY